MWARAIKRNQRALCALIALVTTDFPRLPVVTRTSWPGRQLVTNRLILNLRHWRQLYATWWRAASPGCGKD